VTFANMLTVGYDVNLGPDWSEFGNEERRTDAKKMTRKYQKITIEEIEAKSEIERTDEERKMLAANEARVNKQNDYMRK